jgi:SAM-dependent methyltransferase
MEKLPSREFYNDLYRENGYASDQYANMAIPSLKKFVEDHNLKDATILDIGCGRGWFRNIVKHWIGLDISEIAGKQVRNRFLCGSAENIPLAQESVDAIWSITFLEHSPQPEVALSEMVRVLKNGGILFLAPAWRVPPWRPMGFEVKSFKELTLIGKFFKLLLPILNNLWMKGIFWIPFRALRELRWTLFRKPAKLFYMPFKPNIEEFLLPDSDACNSIDQHEALIWFLSRGFVQPEPANILDRILIRSGPLIISKPTG